MFVMFDHNLVYTKENPSLDLFISSQKTYDRFLDEHGSRMQDKNKIDGWVILLPGEMQNISNIRNIRKENICHKMLLYMIMKEKKKSSSNVSKRNHATWLALRLLLTFEPPPTFDPPLPPATIVGGPWPLALTVRCDDFEWLEI